MPELQNRPLRVFLCHASQDKPAVRELYKRLEAEGWIDPWLDEEKLYPGQDWDLEIEKAVEAADAVIVFLSNNSVTKEGYIQRELRFVLRIADFKPEGTVFVIPLRLDDCPLPRRLSIWQYVDYFLGDQKDWAYQRLLFSLKVRANKLDIQTINLFEEVNKAKKENQELEAAKRIIRIKEIELNAVIAQAEELLNREREEKARFQNELKKYSNEEKTYQEDDNKQIINSPQNKEESETWSDKLIIDGIEFIRIPKGKFVMGYKSEAHEVNIAYDYFLARFPMTNQQFKKFVNASNFSGRWGLKNWNEKLNHPVVNVSWHTAQEYCKWLNQTYGAELSFDYIFRLPTESEWEKAARGSDGRMWPWGNKFDKGKCNSASNLVSLVKVFGSYTTPVGKYSPQGDSPYGVADLAGNVYEWSHSIYQDYPYKVDDGRENGSLEGSRVLRSGSFINSWLDVRSVFRRADNPENSYDNRGFRVALAPKLPE